jgi:hypothetical protein
MGIFLKTLQRHGASRRVPHQAFQLVPSMRWHLDVGVQRKTMGTGTAGACECEEVPCITTARSHTTNCLSGPLEGDAPFDGGSHGTGELGLVSPTSPLKAYYTGQRGPAPHGVPGEAATDARPLLEKTLGKDIWMPQSGSLYPMGALPGCPAGAGATGGVAPGGAGWATGWERAIGGKGPLIFPDSIGFRGWWKTCVSNRMIPPRALYCVWSKQHCMGSQSHGTIPRKEYLCAVR